MLVAALTFAINAGTPSAKNALAQPQEDKVTICHATDSATNPYEMITVDVSAVDGEGQNDHSHHTGPVPTSLADAAQLKAQHIQWGDIIPPVEGVTAGLNWTSAGQAVYNAGCVLGTGQEETTTATLFIQKECPSGVTGGPFTIHISGGISSVSLSCGQTSSGITVNADTQYTVSETPPSGWQDPSIRGLCDGDGTFTLAGGTSGTCVVHNEKVPVTTATLHIQKECPAGVTGGPFTINISGLSSVNLNCGQTSAAITVDADTEYTVSENAVSGWQNPPNIRGLCDGDGTFTLAAGASGTCVVSNVPTVPPTSTATLFINKECPSGVTGGPFTIHISGGISSVSLSCGQTSSGITVDAGTEYTVSETPPSGWQDPSIRGLCDGDGTFTLAAGTSGTCVVHNEKVPVTTATLHIQKECPAGVTGGPFTINISGLTPVSLSCGQTSSGITVDAGTEHTVSENAVSGWQNPPNIRGLCDGDGTFTLAAGATGTCVVSNIPLTTPGTGTLFIQKECPAGVTGGPFTINISGLSPVNLSCGQTSSAITVNAATQYTVSENAMSGWQNPPNIRGLCDGDGTFTLAAGGSGTCVVSNIPLTTPQTGTLFIQKECLQGGTGPFTINISGLPSISLNCGETSSAITVNAGLEYTVSETVPTGWQQPNIRGLCDGDGTFTLAAGASGTCVVSNLPVAGAVAEVIPPTIIVQLAPTVIATTLPPAAPVEAVSEAAPAPTSQVLGVQQVPGGQVASVTALPSTGNGGYTDGHGLPLWPAGVALGAVGLILSLAALRFVRRHG